jgi:hypothetical protein
MCNLDFSSDIYIPTRKFYPSPDAVRVARIGWKVLSSRGSGMDTGLMVTPGYLPFVTEEIARVSLTWWKCFATVTPSSLPKTCGRAKCWVRFELAELVILA